MKQAISFELNGRLEFQIGNELYLTCIGHSLVLKSMHFLSINLTHLSIKAQLEYFIYFNL